MTLMSTHRTNNIPAIGSIVTVTGWVHRTRDHGGILFIDLRDYEGIIQCRIDADHPAKIEMDRARIESIVSITGTIEARPEGTNNPNILTGEVEINVKSWKMINPAAVLPFDINEETVVGEDLRLKYRYLDLRRPTMRKNILLRNSVISFLRKKMESLDFVEFNTPILTSSSPEGARDYLVPSRLHPGKFYALPQAPQIFKQLLMASGFERYFQIAPCFRDEASRSDRLPGEFYQLDMEMAFATQDHVFAVVEEVLSETFKTFSTKQIDTTPWVRIPYKDALDQYGTDKPDLRSPLVMTDVTEIVQDDCPPFIKEILDKGGVVKVIGLSDANILQNKIAKELDGYAKELGMAGLGYLRASEDKTLNPGPLAKFFKPETIHKMVGATRPVTWKDINQGNNDTLIFIAGDKKSVTKWGGQIRLEIAKKLGLFQENVFAFCWITDFPMYELNEETKKIDFSHNPFSLPQGGFELGVKVFDQDPLTILAYQYDLVCNGIELSSGATRNHNLQMLYKAFEIAGYPPEKVDESFPALATAMKYGYPISSGIAPGIERLTMLLADTINVREVVCFPLNGSAECHMMGAPSLPTIEQLRELNLTIKQKLGK